MATRTIVLGIALAGLGMQWFAEVRAEPHESRTNSDIGVYNYPYPDDNWSDGTDNACQGVSARSFLGGPQDWEWKSDAELQKAIECRLTQSPFLKTKGIDVVVRDGTAILSGTVQDQDSLRIAIVDAYQAGVKEVVSELELAAEP